MRRPRRSAGRAGGRGVGGPVGHLGRHLGVVLATQRGVSVDRRSGMGGEPDGLRDDLVPPGHRVLVLGEGVDQLLQCGHGGRRDRRGRAELEPLGRGPGDEEVGHVAVEGVGVGDPGPGRLDALVLDEVGASGLAEQVHVVLTGVGQDGDPTVTGPLGLALGIEDAPVAGGSLGRHRGRRPGVLHQGEGRHDVDHRDLHPLTPAGALPLEQRGQHGVGDGQAADLVGHEARHQHRHAALATEGVGNARAGLDDVVVGGCVGGGGVRGVPLGLAVHDVGADLEDVVVGEPQATEGTGPQVGHHDVDGGGDVEQVSSAGGVLQVEDDVALVAQQVEGEAGQLVHRTGGHHPAERALRVLDGDHVGAQVTEDLGGQRAP